LKPYCFQQLGFSEDKNTFLQNICVTLKLLDERKVLGRLLRRLTINDHVQTRSVFWTYTKHWEKAHERSIISHLSMKRLLNTCYCFNKTAVQQHNLPTTSTSIQPYPKTRTDDLVQKTRLSVPKMP